MRNSAKVSLALAIVLCFVAAQTALAGINSIEGPFDVNGTIVSGRACNGANAGIVILTDTGEETVFGLGPASYWKELGVEFPAAGEYVEVVAYEVTNSDGTTKLVASSITLADGAVTVELRDDEFKPLWGQKGK